MASLSAALRERGYRVTLQRQVILEALESLSGHFTPEDVYAAFRDRYPQVNVSTVYRALEWLEEAGLVAHTHFDNGVVKWHRAEVPAHQHLVCRQCRKEEEIGVQVLDPLTRELRARYGFRADLAHFVIVGLCRDCAEREEKERAGG